jgi:hypothetical protein
LTFEIVLLTGFTFPDNEHIPTGPAQRVETGRIASDGASELRQPILDTNARNISVTTPRVLMPEAAVDEYLFSVTWKDYVRRTGQVFAINPKAIAKPMRNSTYKCLRLASGLSNP